MTKSITMTKNELRQFVNSLPNIVEGISLENCHPEGFNLFQYSALAEHHFEKMLMDMSGRERRTTFYSDLSIGEWYGYVSAVDTIKNCILHWIDEHEMIAEFILCVNRKAWEHYDRGNNGWAQFYSLIYNALDQLFYDYYEGNDEVLSYYRRYMD